MFKVRLSAFPATLLTLALYVSPAAALNTRSFVSGLGSDSNPCTRTAPCRTLQTAHDNTSASGEINMLDPAGYGTVVITKAISIVNDGVGSAGVLVPSGGVGITINAGPTDVINLRGLIIEGSGVGQHGIKFNTGKALTIQNSVVRNLTLDGIAFFPNQSAASTLSVRDVLIVNNGSVGIFVETFGSGAVKAIFNRVEVDNNGVNGIALLSGAGLGQIEATATECVASNSPFDAFEADSNSTGSPATLMLVDSVAVNSGSGIFANGVGGTILLGRTTISGNTNGWVAASSGVVQSYGDNKINGNTTNEGPPPPVSNK